MVSLALLVLQVLAHTFSTSVEWRVVTLCSLYFMACVATRWRAGPVAPAPAPGVAWLPTIGVDLLAIALLQGLHLGNLNYAPLFALPVLMASMLGSVVLALGTAAAVTLLLLGDAWTRFAAQGDTAPFLQAAVAGTGLFVIALLVRQMALRLARETEVARANELTAALQTQVSELVIEALSDGALVVDRHGRVLAANPAARRMLGAIETAGAGAMQLTEDPSWMPLLALVRNTLRSAQPQHADMAIHSVRRNARRLHVRTRITRARHDAQHEALCVVFLQDLREMEARVRTEKLAAMGRMSAAVAHEIRNPLAAILQANALLDEELENPGHRHLAGLVRQNAERLARIAEEVLDISRVQQASPSRGAWVLALHPLVEQVVHDWSAQGERRRRPQLDLESGGAEVEFDPDHLRRVLVNLLDNAQRYAGDEPDAIQVRAALQTDNKWGLEVWSNGSALEDSVERHLFEPFFSSESRSTGLGLFICRELCERHHASIRYQRCVRPTAHGPQPGNAFTIVFRSALGRHSGPGGLPT